MFSNIEMTSAPILVLGVGNPYRSDDGAGIMAARAIASRRPDGVIVRELPGDGTGLMEAWKGAGEVIVIDAIRSGAPAGTIVRLDPVRDPIPGDFFGPSTHSFGVAGALELSRVLNCLPARMILFGIEGKVFDPGTGLSPAVEAAVGEVCRRILRETVRDDPGHGKEAGD